ncbi:hypothetical protein NIASO_05200 [Niabella soli DSM 19437]|uniref:Uncharacterized protein n=1 Tax=Niabella soli DSM 19437 TaxID=929713 RepID=W0F7G2_9BACT|nr:hypothetical protein NIASO_05200 [Niabella soli DSM 19437]
MHFLAYDSIIDRVTKSCGTWFAGKAEKDVFNRV